MNDKDAEDAGESLYLNFDPQLEPELLDDTLGSLLPQLPGTDGLDSLLTELNGGHSFTAESPPLPQQQNLQGTQVPVEERSIHGEQEQLQKKLEGLGNTDNKQGSRYALRPRSARSSREQLGTQDLCSRDDLDSEAASQDSGEGLSRESTGKRLSRTRTYATSVGRGMAVVSRGVSESMHAALDAARGGVSGLAKALPKKRSRDPEVIKDKERARNRRAQKAFRERQKVLQEERKTSMRSLQDHMGRLAQENAELQQKLQTLESSATDPGPSSQVPAVDFACQFDAREEISVRLSANSAYPVELNADEVQALTWEGFVAIWKDYVDTLSSLLAKADATESREGDEQMNTLVKEAAKLSQAYASLNTYGWLDFQNGCMTDPEPQAVKAPPAHWAMVLGKLEVTELQAAEILERRREVLAMLGKIIQQRRTLLHLQTEAIASLNSERVEAKDVRIAHSKAIRAANELAENLKAEQCLLLQGLCTAQQKVLTPRQIAIKIVYSWPFYPDTLEISSQLATKWGEPSIAQLLGINDRQQPLQ